MCVVFSVIVCICNIQTKQQEEIIIRIVTNYDNAVVSFIRTLSRMPLTMPLYLTLS